MIMETDKSQDLQSASRRRRRADSASSSRSKSKGRRKLVSQLKDSRERTLPSTAFFSTQAFNRGGGRLHSGGQPVFRSPLIQMPLLQYHTPE